MTVLELDPRETREARLAAEEAVVFVGGCDRSGTTVLGRLLAQRLSLVALPEAYFHALAFRRFGPGVDGRTATRHWRRRSWELGPSRTQPAGSLAELMQTEMHRLHGRQRGEQMPTRVVESTPENIEIGSILLEHFPGAHLVHVVRDPRAVAASLLQVDFGPVSAQECVRLWKQRIASGLALEMRRPERVHRVRYEDAVAAPEGLDFLDALTASPCPDRSKRGDVMLDFTSAAVQRRVRGDIDATRAEAWRDALSARQIGTIEYECRELMGLFGYELTGLPDRRSAPGRRLDTLASAAGELSVGNVRRATRVARALVNRRRSRG